MRHLVSLVLGPVLGFAAYILFGFGATRISIEDGWSSDNVVGLLAMIGAGVAYSVLVIPRLSPIGPALVGVAYLGVGLWIVSDLESFLDTMRADLLGLDNSGFGAGSFLLALAVPLLATLVSPYRWASRPRPAAQPVPAQPPPGTLANQPNQFGGPPPFGGEAPPFGGGPQPGHAAGFGAQPGHAAGFGPQQGYGTPPIGAPYSGPPSFGPPPGSPVAAPGSPMAPPPGSMSGPPPGSPVAPSGYDPYGPPPAGNPNDPLRPDITRRIQ